MKPIHFLALGALSTGCEVTDRADFRVRVENVSAVRPILKTGTFDTALDATQPGPIGPGQVYEFTFTAPPGARLSFASMFGQSNDFFVAPDEEGIELYPGGVPVAGDVTSEISLWDAGTEINQEPGAGADQAPRQAAPDTGADDPNDLVRLADDTFGNLPAIADYLEVTLTPLGNDEFRVRFANVSDASTLQTTGGAVPLVLSPGVWAIHTDPAPLFTVGEAAPAGGIEALAEEGAVATLGETLAADAGVNVALSPGVYALFTGSDDPILDANEPALDNGLEELAEDGDPDPLADALELDPDVIESDTFTVPMGQADAGPLMTGEAYQFEFSAEEGDRLTLATMFVPSNDLFFAPEGAGIALFEANDPLEGDLTDEIGLWDAGTEVNQELGVGRDQVQNQPEPNTGADEDGVVRPISATDYADLLPPVEEMIQVTIETID